MVPGTGGRPHRPGLPSSTLAGSCGNKRQRQGGREGPEALQLRTRAAAAGTAARLRGWSQLPAALCSQNDRVKKKRGGEKNTNTAKQLLGPDAEFRSPLMCLFFAFVPVEDSPWSGTGQEAAQAAAQGKGESPGPAAEQKPGEPWAWPQGRRSKAVRSPA